MREQTQVGGAAAQVEPDGTYSQCVQGNDVFIRRIERQSSDAVAFGKSWVTECLRAAYPLGHGHGPVNALFRLTYGS